MTFVKALKKLDQILYLGDFGAIFDMSVWSKFLTPVLALEWMGAIMSLQKGTQTLEQMSQEQILFLLLWPLNATLVTSEC